MLIFVCYSTVNVNSPFLVLLSMSVMIRVNECSPAMNPNRGKKFPIGKVYSVSPAVLPEGFLLAMAKLAREAG